MSEGRNLQDKLRALPSVDELARGCALEAGWERKVEASRVEIEAARQRLLSGEAAGDLGAALEARLRGMMAPSLRRVINATGVVLHTNLGRAPLPDFGLISGYSNLEYDLVAGKRGKRDSHFVPVLEQLLGFPAIAVNNNAAATYLTLRELAQGGEVIVSRGELVEIGDGFRIPDIMAESGAILREVGTTNRTRVADYERAITEKTRLILRVHPSNFRVTGFTEKPDIRELAAMAKSSGVPLYEDIGSGCLVDLKPLGIDEPMVQESLAAGADVVSFSTDKLLGGPQAGIVAGRAELIARLRRHPMYRAMRLDKLQVQALESALRLLWARRFDAIPALHMMMTPADVIKARAERLAAELPGFRVEAGESMIGGGSTPEQALPTHLLAWSAGDVVGAEKRLREGDPPVIARISEGRLLFDVRTVLERDEGELVRVVRGALA